jgi:hypothetical protein
MTSKIHEKQSFLRVFTCFYGFFSVATGLRLATVFVHFTNETALLGVFSGQTRNPLGGRWASEVLPKTRTNDTLSCFGMYVRYIMQKTRLFRKTRFSGQKPMFSGPEMSNIAQVLFSGFSGQNGHFKVLMVLRVLDTSKTTYLHACI